MINYWWTPRAKRALNSIPEVLAALSDLLNQKWQRRRDLYLAFEEMLEELGLKRKGTRRDKSGSGARTYIAELTSLGLIFRQKSTNLLCFTLAGEAILNGDSPVQVLTNQVLKYQLPSSYSLGQNVNVSDRFKIRPFRFLLRLLADERIEYLTQEEIAKIVIVEAEQETDACFEYIVKRILSYRKIKDKALPDNFFGLYRPNKRVIDISDGYDFFLDIANTITNWLEYTQLALRSEEDDNLRILPEKRAEVEQILAIVPAFINRPEEHEFFQRKYGLDPKHQKDNRNLTETKTITKTIINTNKVKMAFIGLSLKQPIGNITAEIVEAISNNTGVSRTEVEKILVENYPHGAIGSFMTEYFEMAFRGKDDATEFEKATVSLFNEVFKFNTKHVGPIGLTPDVLVVSDVEDFCGIIDNKAYSKYTISNDHKNRMIQNYIGNLAKYYDGDKPLAFFLYIAGGFGTNIDAQIADIAKETGIPGSAISVSNMIKLVELYPQKGYDHARIKEIFSVNRQVLLSDLE